MERTLQEHLRFLEEHILTLTAEMATPMSTEQERNHLQSEILIAEEALSFYQNADELENKESSESLVHT